MRAALLALLLAACEPRPMEDLRVRVYELQDRVVDVSARMEALDRCLVQKLAESESDFQTRMAVMTCLTVSRGKGQ